MNRLEAGNLASTWPSREVHTRRQVDRWNAHTYAVDQSIKVQDDTFHIVLSPNGGQLLSLSPPCIKLFDLESKICLAQLGFHSPLKDTVQASFASDGMSISVRDGDEIKCWYIMVILLMIFVAHADQGFN